MGCFILDINKDLATSRKLFVISIALVVGGLHFVIGPHYDGPLQPFVSGYLIDILLPFMLYFLIRVSNRLTGKITIGAIVFGVGAVVETLQGLGYPVLGTTFDPIDYGMYGTGVLLAIVVDFLIYSKLKPHDA